MSSHIPPGGTDPRVARLMAEIEHVETRPVEELGIPTFLVAEDLTEGALVPTWTSGAADELGVDFAKLAAILASCKPELEVSDVAKLIQVFADRRFPGAGAGPLIDESLLPASDEEAPQPPSVLLAELVEGMKCSRVVRAVNFHATPQYREAEYRDQIAAYARAFEPITPVNFASALDGSWPHARPGLMPFLFEGFRDNYDVMLPILEEHGFIGWFVMPTAFPEVPVEQQRSYAEDHELDPALTDEYPGERIAITWDEARDIRRRGHVFACHSRSHHRLNPDSPIGVLEDEVVGAKAEMEARLGCEIDVFCWLGGAAIGVNPEADRLVRQAGVRYLLSGFKIQKLA